MNSNLNYVFAVNKETNTVTIKRGFAAERSLVWDTYTKPELLDQWWGPKPWVARTKKMEFKVGGRRVYAMCGPAGEEHWSIQEFTFISPKTNFKFFDAFCDKDENINKEWPSSDWDVNFADINGSTQVNIVIKHDSLASLEKILEMGFEEGMGMIFEGLDELLVKLKK